MHYLVGWNDLIKEKANCPNIINYYITFKRTFAVIHSCPRERISIENVIHTLNVDLLFCN